MNTNRMKLAASGKIARTHNRVLRPQGWNGGYKRPAPTGAHKCLTRSEMAALIAKLG